MTRVAITGAGLLSPLGRNLETYCQALFAGKCAIRRIRYDAPGGTTDRMVAPLDEIPLPPTIKPTETRFYSQLSRAAMFCADQAIKQSGLSFDTIDPQRAGAIFGSGFINLYDLEPVYDKFFTGDERHLSPLVIPINMANCPAGRMSLVYGLRGITRTVSTACSSASTALADALRLVRDGSHDVILAGGADLICCTSLVRSWERLRVLCPPGDDPALACRPFDRDRNGLALGDGAAMFVLENYARARDRGAVILAEVAGAFESSDGYDMLKPSAAGETHCMQNALASAGVAAGDIDCVQVHGTATQLNDKTEYIAMRQVFGDRVSDIPACAIKSMIGHTMGASGAFSVAAALGTFAGGYVYPVPGFRAADDSVDVRVSSVGEKIADIDHVLVNAFGFGGANACLVLRGPQDD